MARASTKRAPAKVVINGVEAPATPAGPLAPPVAASVPSPRAKVHTGLANALMGPTSADLNPAYNDAID